MTDDDSADIGQHAVAAAIRSVADEVERGGPLVAAMRKAVTGLYGVRYICSFCGKDETQTRQIIAGDNGNICNECVSQCVAVLLSPTPTMSTHPLPSKTSDLADTTGPREER